MPAKRRTRVLAQSSATSAAASSLSSPSSAAAAATSAATTKRRSATTSRKGRGGKGAAGRGRIRGAGGRGGAGSVVTAEALPVATSSCNLVGVLTLSETALRLLRANPQADVVLDWINSQSAQPARPVVPTLAVGSSRFSLLEVSAPPHAHADVVVRQRHQCNFAGTISKEFQLSDMVVCDSSSENELRRLLLHQLAPKPLMRQHILDQWEGRESLVNKVLDEIAKSQSNGALILRNRAYLEVRPFEWQLYTEIERDTVIRNGRIAFTDLRLSPSAPEWRNLEPLPAVPSGLAVSLNEPVPAGTRSRGGPRAKSIGPAILPIQSPPAIVISEPSRKRKRGGPRNPDTRSNDAMRANATAATLSQVAVLDASPHVKLEDMPSQTSAFPTNKTAVSAYAGGENFDHSTHKSLVAAFIRRRQALEDLFELRIKPIKHVLEEAKKASLRPNGHQQSSSPFQCVDLGRLFVQLTELGLFDDVVDGNFSMAVAAEALLERYRQERNDLVGLARQLNTVRGGKFG